MIRSLPSALSKGNLIPIGFISVFTPVTRHFSGNSSGEKSASIPIEKLDFAYSRCSGPGIDLMHSHIDSNVGLILVDLNYITRDQFVFPLEKLCID